MSDKYWKEVLIEELGLKHFLWTEVVDKIRELKANQRLPDYSLGKYRNVCPHGRPLSEACPQCYSSPNKFRE
jgi:hypothetical protein